MRGYICNLCRHAIQGEAHPVRIGVPVPVGTDTHLCSDCKAKLEAPGGVVGPERPPMPGEAATRLAAMNCRFMSDSGQLLYGISGPYATGGNRPLPDWVDVK